VLLSSVETAQPELGAEQVLCCLVASHISWPGRLVVWRLRAWIPFGVVCERIGLILRVPNVRF
jgi:hypothetical protein